MTSGSKIANRLAWGELNLFRAMESVLVAEETAGAADQNGPEPDDAMIVTHHEGEAREIVKEYAIKSLERRDQFVEFMRSMRLRVVSLRLAAKQDLDTANKVETALDKMEAHVIELMNEVAARELTGERHAIKLRDNPPRVVIDDESEIPFDLFVIDPPPPAPPPRPDKPAIGKLLKAGSEVAGAHLERGQRLEMAEVKIDKLLKPGSAVVK